SPELHATTGLLGRGTRRKRRVRVLQEPQFRGLFVYPQHTAHLGEGAPASRLELDSDEATMLVITLAQPQAVRLRERLGGEDDRIRGKVGHRVAIRPYEAASGQA